MFKQIFLCAALCTPLACTVAGEIPEEGISEEGISEEATLEAEQEIRDTCPGHESVERPEKDLCNDIGGNYWKCVHAPQCFWDTSDQRCEWVSDPSFCAQIFSPGQCQSMPNCFWDTSDQRCERLN